MLLRRFWRLGEGGQGVYRLSEGSRVFQRPDRGPTSSPCSCSEGVDFILSWEVVLAAGRLSWPRGYLRDLTARPEPQARPSSIPCEVSGDSYSATI